MTVAQPTLIRNAALSGRACPAPQVRQALTFLVKFHYCSADTSAGIGILVAPDLVVTCQHLGSPGSKDYFCKPVIDATAPSRRIIEIYEEGQLTAIPSSDFINHFRNRAVQGLQERLAIARLSEPMAVTDFPTMVDWVAGQTYTHTGVFGGQGGCAPSLLAGIRVHPEPWTSSLVCEWPGTAGSSTPVPGDSGGGLFEADSNFRHLMGIQHVIGTYNDSPTIVSMHIPITRAKAWINAIFSATQTGGHRHAQI